MRDESDVLGENESQLLEMKYGNSFDDATGRKRDFLKRLKEEVSNCTEASECGTRLQAVGRVAKLRSLKNV